MLSSRPKVDSILEVVFNFGAFFDNSSIDTTFLDNTSTDSGDDDINDKYIIDGGSNSKIGANAHDNIDVSAETMLTMMTMTMPKLVMVTEDYRN